jgi:hypothetical protein
MASITYLTNKRDTFISGKLNISIDVPHTKHKLSNEIEKVAYLCGGKIFGGHLFNKLIRTKVGRKYWETVVDLPIQQRISSYSNKEFLPELSDRLIGYDNSDIDVVLPQDTFDMFIDAMHKNMSSIFSVTSTDIPIHNYSWCSSIDGVRHKKIYFKIFKQNIISVDVLTSTNDYEILTLPAEFHHNGLVQSDVDTYESRVVDVDANSLIQLCIRHELVMTVGYKMSWSAFYKRYVRAYDKGFKSGAIVSSFTLDDSKINGVVRLSNDIAFGCWVHIDDIPTLSEYIKYDMSMYNRVGDLVDLHVYEIHELDKLAGTVVFA